MAFSIFSLRRDQIGHRVNSTVADGNLHHQMEIPCFVLDRNSYQSFVVYNLKHWTHSHLASPASFGHWHAGLHLCVCHFLEQKGSTAGIHSPASASYCNCQHATSNETLLILSGTCNDWLAGMLCALIAAAVWLIFATYAELPVSTTHSIGKHLDTALHHLVHQGSDASHSYWKA